MSGRASLVELAPRLTLDAVLSSMNDAVFITDAEGRSVDVNDAFVSFHRLRSKEECPRALAEWGELMEVFFPGGEVVPPSQWPVPRALRGETGTSVEYRVRRRDTGEAWIGSYSFAPVRDEAGAIIGSVVMGRDITEQQRTLGELGRHREHLEELVTQRTEALDEARRAAEAASRAKSAFLTNMSHELRTPLNGIVGAIELLRREDPTAQQALRLDRMLTAARQLQTLLNQLLDLAAIEAGQLTPQGAAPDVDAVLRDVQERSMKLAEAPEEPADALLTRLHQGKRILLVEDDPLSQETTLELLRDVGLAPSLARDGAEAVRMAEADRYDLVLMDLRMPRLSGLQATEAIRRLPGWGQVPILALTANAFAEDLERCQAAGMDDVVTKPIDIERLFTALLQWLGPGEGATATRAAR